MTVQPQLGPDLIPALLDRVFGSAAPAGAYKDPTIVELESGHDAMITHPFETAQLLMRIAEDHQTKET